MTTKILGTTVLWFTISSQYMSSVVVGIAKFVSADP